MLAALNEIEWLNLHDAYGPADTIADAIRALLSDDPEKREQARQRLFSTIYHQGDIFDSTAAAIPFLVDIFVADESPDRNELGELIEAIAESAQISDNQIRKRWKRQYELWGDVHTQAQTEFEQADSDIAVRRAVRTALLSTKNKLVRLFNHPPMELADICSQLETRFKGLGEVQAR